MSGLTLRGMTHVLAAAVLASLVLPVRAENAPGTPLPFPTLTLDAYATGDHREVKTAEKDDEESEHPCYFAALYFENDGTFAHPGGTDKHYTSAEGLSFAYQPQWARSLGQYIPSFFDQFNPDHADTSFAVGVVAYQDLYSPTDLSRRDAIYNDHPYAAIINGGIFWQRAAEPEHEGGWTHATMEHYQLDLGIVGPSAQGEETQKFVHGNFSTGAVRPEGWDNQINDEFGFNLTYLRKWRFTLLDQATKGIAVQVIPEAGLTAGTLARYATAELVARAGWNLPDDFGPGRLHEVAAFTARRETESWIGFYVFGRLGGQLVEHNTFLAGGNFRNSPVTVTEIPAVGEVQGGLAIQLFEHVEVVYSQTLRSQEFRHQDGPDVYGAWTVTVSWPF